MNGLRVGVVLGLAGAALAAACSSSDPGSTYSAAVAGDDAGDLRDGGVLGVDGNTFGGSSDGSAPVCDEACPNGSTCNHGVCIPSQAGCASNADCQFDSYCSGGQCVPYGSPPDGRTNDPTCKVAIAPGVLAPDIKCEFAKPPAGDPFPDHVDVQATPIVITLDGASNPPSIVAPFTQPVPGGYTETLGIVRVLKGTDCSLEANLGGIDLDGDGRIDWVRSSSPVAAADLDGDGAAEIVMYMADNTTVAFTRKSGAWKPLWPKVKATLADGVRLFVSALGGGWAGPSIHDLDDDGKPEIVREGYVIDGATGKLRAELPQGYATYGVGIPAVLAKLRGTGVQLTNGAHIWTFDGTANAWTLDPAYEAHISPSGWAAIADFDPYDGQKTPEIAVASSGRLAVYTLDHAVFLGLDVPVPGGGGGPPTIADYDGDGLPEVGLAGADYYTVFDPDCQATPRTNGKCADRTHCDSFPGGGCPDYILWSKKTQDHSSNITGSSVFDFEADGVAEVVYADECFARVYSGIDGRVLFSQYHSSCTWLENPVIADVDGDFHAELVVPSNTACGVPGTGIGCAGSLDANGVDARFAGLGCKEDADCFSGVCDSGLCRCTSGAQCCAGNTDAACLENGYTCVPPPAGTPGTGNTCRAARPHGVQGIRVYKDAKNRWVRSRKIWSQHAYAVTHVNEDGTIPKTSAWADNWTSAGLDNFRQNVPGTADGTALGDLTTKAGPFFACSGGAAVMTVPVCNRGTAPIGAGASVGFYDGATKICTTTTTSAIDVGQCADVSCTWATPPPQADQAVDVTVVANDDGAASECDAKNDKGRVLGVYCQALR